MSSSTGVLCQLQLSHLTLDTLFSISMAQISHEQQTSRNLGRAYARQRTQRTKDDNEKPLPIVPSRGLTDGRSLKPLPPKPLPDIPQSNTGSKLSILRKTFLLVGALCIWFLAVVVLLPVITERDAMPGFNRFLRRILSFSTKESKYPQIRRDEL